jgi:hypothetical protein
MFDNKNHPVTLMGKPFHPGCFNIAVTAVTYGVHKFGRKPLTCIQFYLDPPFIRTSEIVRLLSRRGAPLRYS